MFSSLERLSFYRQTRALHFGLDLAVVAILGQAVPPEPRSPDLCADDSVEDGRLARSARLCRDCRPSLP